MILILIDHSGNNLAKDSSSIIHIWNEPPQRLIILFTVKYKYGWFNSKELLEPKDNQLRALYSYVIGIHKIGFFTSAKDESVNK